ncbi:hypothetical protein [Sporisorium scitamineum]|uniref:Uncharacterized protein n=1 Tax=Sporisorium scitamineum TaxID=49012 RepID=A0A0F7S6R8_9BASI|nr:hypothetical protein [Sporisorium scitamineum]
MVECISTHGPPPLPMVIFKGKAHQQGWYQDHAAAKDWMFATTKGTGQASSPHP